jgi:hypothetical protein
LPEHRPDELAQTGVRQRGLRRSSTSVEPPHVHHLPLGVAKQRRLPDTRLANHQQGATRPTANLGQQFINPRALSKAPNQHLTNLTAQRSQFEENSLR